MTDPLIDPREARRRAWRYMHFAADVTLDDALELEPDHRLVTDAWRSWRSADANFDSDLQAAHGPRRLLADDTWGPATERMVLRPRCPCPDHSPVSGMNFAGLDGWEQELLESYRAKFEGGVGSWPFPGCVPGAEHVHSIRVNMDTSRMPAKVGAYFDRAVRGVQDACAEFGLRVVIVKDGDPQKAEIEVKWEHIPGGTIGYQFFPRPNTCHQTVKGRLDTNYQPDDWVMFGRLWGHEHCGHGLGLEHTRGGWLNPTINYGLGLTWKGDPHETTMRNYFGGQPIPVDPGEPSPPTPTEQLVIRGQLEIDGHPGKYIVVPAPGL